MKRPYFQVVLLFVFLVILLTIECCLSTSTKNPTLSFMTNVPLEQSHGLTTAVNHNRNNDNSVAGFFNVNNVQGTTQSSTSSKCEIFDLMDQAIAVPSDSAANVTNYYSTKSCNFVKLFASAGDYIQLQGVDLFYGPKGVSLCDISDPSLISTVYPSFSCLDFLNDTFTKEEGILEDLSAISSLLESRFNNSSPDLIQWPYKVMSKALELQFVNKTSTTKISELLDLYNYCNFCNHPNFDAFHGKKAVTPALQMPMLQKAFTNSHCGSGIPTLNAIATYEYDGYFVTNVVIQCTCRGGVVTNECGIFSEFLYPMFSGPALHSISLIFYTTIALVSFFVNFIPILMLCVRRFQKSSHGVRSFFYHFLDLRLQASVLFLCSIITAITSSCLGLASNSYVVLLMTIAACLQFISTVPILFCWIDVIYRTEMNMKEASSLVVSLSFGLSSALVFALALYIVGYSILSTVSGYRVLFIIVQVFLIVVIMAAVMIAIILTITAARLLFIISKTKKIQIFSFRFTRFLLYATICGSPFLLQAAYYIVIIIDTKMICRFYLMFSYYLASLCVTFISFGYMYILFNSDDVMKCYPFLEKLTEKFSKKK